MTVTLYVQPGAQKTEFAGEHNGHRKLKVHAPAVEGAANRAVTDFIAKTLGLPKSAVSLIGGEKARLKTFSLNEERIKNPQALSLFS
jgi:uncharacterized protein (TIGR00251 family)